MKHLGRRYLPVSQGGSLAGVISSSDLLYLQTNEENHQHKLPYNFDLKAYNQAMF